MKIKRIFKHFELNIIKILILQFDKLKKKISFYTENKIGIKYNFFTPELLQLVNPNYGISLFKILLIVNK